MFFDEAMDSEKRTIQGVKGGAVTVGRGLRGWYRLAVIYGALGPILES